MKFMNNHYGQSIIFKHARRVAADNGDLLDGNIDGGDGTGGGGSGDNGVSDDDNEDNTAELIASLQAELEKAKATNERLKNANNNLSSENNKYKKQNRQFMTDEQKNKEDLDSLKAELEELRKASKNNKYSKRLVGIGMTETDADELASLIPSMEDSDAFFDALSKFVESVKKSSSDSAVQKLLKDHPDIHSGNGDTNKETSAMQFAKAAVERNKVNGGFNSDALKQFM